MKNIVILLLLSVSLVSCAVAPPKYSQVDINAAKTRENQISLYNSIKSELAADSKSQNAVTYRRMMDDLGKKLGQEEAARILEYVNSSRMESGLVPLSVLSKAEASAAPIRSWQQSEYNKLTTELVRQTDMTNSALQKEESYLSTLNADYQLASYILALRQIRDLRGENSDAELKYSTAYEAAHEKLESTGDQALRNLRYLDALQAYQSLQMIDPGFPNIEQLISSSQSGVESFDLRQLLLDGDIEGAYSSFLALSSKQMPYEEKMQFVGPVSNLAQYFANNARSTVQAAQYSDSYNMMKREMAIRNWLNEPSQLSNTTIAEFTEAMFDLSVASNARDLFGLEYGYLLLVEEFNPNYMTLESRQRETEQNVYNSAIRRVGSVAIKSSNPTDQKIASQIAAGVREYLMDNIPEDVKIVEREKLSEVIRERSMNTDFDASMDSEKLESADYLIEGELLAVEVHGEVKDTTDKIRVVTGQEKVANPDYQDWIKRKGIRKADHPDAPPKTILEDVEEDIDLHIEEHRKFGEVGVTYRVIDTNSAELVHSDSVSRSKRVSDQSREGVRYGEFVQEVKLAELPSDMEIYDELIDQVVDYMAKDLVTFLANPDGNYFKNCKQLADEDENLLAAEQCANAAVLLKFKSKQNSDAVNLLKTVTLISGMRRN